MRVWRRPRAVRGGESLSWGMELPELERVLIDRRAISERVRAVGQAIARDFEEELSREGVDPGSESRVVIVGVLTGSLVFLADLIRELPLKLSIELITVSSYPGKTTVSQGVRVRDEMPDQVAGKHVLVVDDILDTGRTLSVIRDRILAQGASSLRICVLLRKECERVVDVDVDYVGFDIPDEFVVGYGLDYDGFYRNCPDIAILRTDLL